MNLQKDGNAKGKIVSDLTSLRRKLGGLEAKRVTGVPYAVKSAKELMSKIRDAADELGMLMVGSPVDVHIIHEPTERGSKVHVTGKYRFMSNDGTYVDFMGVGTGMSTDDKSAGKASTYAWKECIVKALSLPDAELIDTDDEVVGPNVYDLIADIENCETLSELKALKPRLNALSENERGAAGPSYIRAAASLRDK